MYNNVQFFKFQQLLGEEMPERIFQHNIKINIVCTLAYMC